MLLQDILGLLYTRYRLRAIAGDSVYASVAGSNVAASTYAGLSRLLLLAFGTRYWLIGHSLASAANVLLAIAAGHGAVDLGRPTDELAPYLFVLLPVGSLMSTGAFLILNPSISRDPDILPLFL